MSLRVLLGDESASIRKVFQMGLQDYGAEVKSVHNGVDVIGVAESFKPDILFIDILLQKKSGYDVTEELRKHPSLNQLPIVLMWSSFMELDRAQYEQCGASGELEKPFDVETMRKLIQKYVSKTQSQQLSQFLQFPDTITQDFIEDEESKADQNQSLDSTPSLETTDTDVTSPDPAGFAMELDIPEPAEAPVPEDTQGDIERDSVFNFQEAEESSFDSFTPVHKNSENDSSASLLSDPVKTDPVEERPTSLTESMSDIDFGDWQPAALQQPKEATDRTQTEVDEDLDQFQAMDLGTPQKMDLNDFLYKPDPVEPKPDAKRPEHTSSVFKQVENLSVPGYESETHQPPVTMTLEEQESIIRSEVRAFLTREIKGELPSLLERVVREELEKIMQEELDMKGSSPHTP